MFIFFEESLDTAKNNYSSYAGDMELLKTKLETAVDDIRSGWDTEAGETFFAKFDDEWKKNFDDYIAVINHMAENMQIAINEYQEIVNEAEELNLIGGTENGTD